MRFACILLLPKDEVLQLSLAEACLRFSPEISLGSRTIILEIGKCRTLYSEELFIKRVQVLLKRFGLSAKVWIASDIPSSVAGAMYGRALPAFLPIEALYCYFSPFTFDLSLEPMVRALRKLGVETLAEFIQLPHHSIAKKFGKDGLLALHRYLHAHQVVWNRFQVSEKIIEQFNVESHEALYDYDSISFFLKRILDRVVMRTCGLGQLISKMRLKFYLDTYSSYQETEREWLLEFSFPHRSVRAFLDMIRDRVGADLQKKSLSAPVLRIELEVLEMVKGNPSQFQFFSQQEEQQENMNLLIERITNKLGKENVFYAVPFESYIPERSWKKAMLPVKAKELRLRSRPLRLFSKPELLRQLDQYLILREYRWKILQLVGPERITGEWWLDDHARDYFEVHTDQEILWVYRKPLTQELFLHGVFD